MDRVEITLSRRYEAHGKPFDKLVVKEPSADLFFKLGEIENWQPGARGSAIRVVYDDVVVLYLRECVQSPAEGVSGTDAMSELSLADAKKLRETFIDFFAGRTTAGAPS